MNPRQAAEAAGVSAEYARQLNKKMGGVYRPPGASYDARYLDREERYEIARLREAGLSIRQIAARLGRSPSTICRELGRNADPRTGAVPARAGRPAGVGAAAPPQAVEAQPEPGPARRRCRACWTAALLARAGQREAQGEVPRTTRRCGSATRRSTSPSTSTPAAGSAGS